MKSLLVLAGLILTAFPAGASTFTMEQVLHYPFQDQLVAAERADCIAWVRRLDGARNIWIAQGPEFKPRQLTQTMADDGQDITQLSLSPDCRYLVYVRGGDASAISPSESNLPPDPASLPEVQKEMIWSISVQGGAPKQISEGAQPLISPLGQLVFLKGGRVWTAPLEGEGKTERLFFDRGADQSLTWSPDGKRLAFISSRGDHAFVSIFSSKSEPIRHIAPSTSIDDSPRWSPDGKRLAFTRRPGRGGEPEPAMKLIAHPWAIWIADAATGAGHEVWKSPETLQGSMPDTAGEANLHWADGDRLTFLAWLDDWSHLYSMPASGGKPLLLTPGAFMVEHVSESRDGKYLIYDANAGKTSGDIDRRHIFRVPVDRAEPVPLTSGDTLEWTPASAAEDRIAYVAAGARQPPMIAIAALDGSSRQTLDTGALPADFPLDQLVTPKSVTFKAADGMVVHGQLFQQDGGPGTKPGIIFVHGGPERQMLVGWHYRGYYSNAYAMNQYLAAHGFVVLSVNYRLGIGYGRAQHVPEHGGSAGASEYQDVLAGAHFLAAAPGVDGTRIGIWGGSYGGYLTGLALARNSDLFKAGVAWHGIYDWTRFFDLWYSLIQPREGYGKVEERFEKGDREAMMKSAWASSPVSAVARWKSPVLLVHGDDDRNAQFHQTVDVARRLAVHHVPYQELIIPDEVHSFLREAAFLEADKATAEFLTRHLHP